MSLTLVTAPTQEPMTTAEAKTHLRLDTSDDDAYVDELITAARKWVEGQTKRSLVQTTWDQKIDYCWPTKGGIPHIRLEKNPVSSVTSITYFSGASPNPTLSASDYTVVSREYGSYITPAYNVTFPTPRWVPECITVRFVAGSTSSPLDVPEPLVHAMKVLIAHWYENREVGSIPPMVESLISPYR